MTGPIEKARRMALRRDTGTRAWPVAPPPMRRTAGLVAHACFACRKSRKLLPDDRGHRCPHCGQPVALMGRSFKAPPRSALDQWEKVQRLWDAGFRFTSYRSHPDAEKLPDKLSEVQDFIARNPDHPMRLAKP